MKRHPKLIFGVKHLIRVCTSDRFVTSLIRGDGHIIGVKKEQKAI